MTRFVKWTDVAADEFGFCDIHAVVDIFDRDPHLQWHRVATGVIALRFDGRHRVFDSQTDQIAHGERLDDRENPHLAVAGIRLRDRSLDAIMADQDIRS